MTKHPFDDAIKLLNRFATEETCYPGQFTSYSRAIAVLGAAGKANRSEIELAMAFFDADDTRGSCEVLRAVLAALPPATDDPDMKPEYDFSKGTRINAKGRTK